MNDTVITETVARIMKGELDKEYALCMADAETANREISFETLSASDFESTPLGKKIGEYFKAAEAVIDARVKNDIPKQLYYKAELDRGLEELNPSNPEPGFKKLPPKSLAALEKAYNIVLGEVRQSWIAKAVDKDAFSNGLG